MLGWKQLIYVSKRGPWYTDNHDNNRKHHWENIMRFSYVSDTKKKPIMFYTCIVCQIASLRGGRIQTTGNDKFYSTACFSALLRRIVLLPQIISPHVAMNYLERKLG